MKPGFSPLLSLLLMFSIVGPAFGGTESGIPLAPLSGADGRCEAVNIGGRKAWHSLAGEGGAFDVYLYFRAPETLPAPEGAVYLEVTYRDVGEGRLSVEYNDGEGRDYRISHVGFNRVMAASQRTRSAVFELSGFQARHAQNLGADLRLVSPDRSAPLEVFEARLFPEPPASFREQSVQPWLDPYTGPTRDDIDASTLKQKVLAGYQGWFRTPGDGTESGWIHWSRDANRLSPRSVTFEMWPDLEEFPESERVRAPGFSHPDGSAAYLYSSVNPGVIDRHFDWMQKYGLDGVLVQRFVVGLRDDPGGSSRVLGHVRASANRTGRVFAVEYDLSGTPASEIVDRVTRDWTWMVQTWKLTEDPRYLHHQGRPVVAIFGFYPDRFDASIALSLLDVFQKPGPLQAVVIGGCPWSWGTEKDPGWVKVYQRLDVVKPWNVGNVSRSGGVVRASTGRWASDLEEARKNGQILMPVLYPGFRWDNLKRLRGRSSEIPRRRGAFLWEQFVEARKLGVDSAFLAMFDEVDEGTALFKVTNNPPVEARFATFEGLPSDTYLRLSGEGSAMLRGDRPLREQPPVPLEP